MSVWWIAAVLLFAGVWGVMIWPHLQATREVTRIRSAIYTQCSRHENDDTLKRDNWRVIRAGLNPSDKPKQVLEALWDLAVLRKESRSELQSYCNNLCAQALHQVALEQAIPPQESEFSKPEWFSELDAMLTERASRRRRLQEHERTLLEKLEELRAIGLSS